MTAPSPYAEASPAREIGKFRSKHLMIYQSLLGEVKYHFKVARWPFTPEVREHGTSILFFPPSFLGLRPHFQLSSTPPPPIHNYLSFPSFLFFSFLKKTSALVCNSLWLNNRDMAMITWYHNCSSSSVVSVGPPLCRLCGGAGGVSW